MTGQPQTLHWKPIETGRWARRAYGRNVMLQSEGGTLATRLRDVKKLAQLYLHGVVEGRMLIEVYQDGFLVFETLISNDDLDCFVELSVKHDKESSDIEVHFIPAVHGMVKIHRAVQCTTKALSVHKRLKDLRNQIEIRDDLTMT